MPSAFQVARTKRASRVLKEKLTGRFQPKKTTHVAAGVGSRAVTIDGRLFPSSDEVSVGTMVNVGRPAAARYAPESGGGGGTAVVVGGGGGSSTSAPSLSDYLRLDGTSVMIGDLNVGGQDILNVNNINGTSVDELIDNSHERLHDILSTDDHEFTAPMWTLVGATATDTLGGLTPSSDGRVERILKSSSAGGLRLETMTTDTRVTTPVVASSGDLVLDPSTIYHQVRVDGILTGGLGSSSTSGTLDWNDISNARSGQGYSLLQGNHSNGPSVTTSTYFHPFGFEYVSKNGTGNITQLAIPYGYGQGINAGIWMRGRYLSSWTDWVRVISENTNGSVGINTISPSASYVLDVNGDTRISGDLDVDETVYADTSLETPLITTATDQDLLIAPAGNGLVLFPTSQTVGSVDFGSSFPIEGWRIYEFDGITGKNGLTIGSISADELFIKYFVADETRIRRGQQYWTYSNGTLSRAFITPDAIDGTVRLYFENSPQIDGAIFVSGDWLLVQYISNAGGGFILQNIWGQVSDYATSGNGEEAGEQSWLFTLKGGLTGVEVGKGAEAIDFGQTGAALIQLSVVDAAGSPYIDMRRWAGSDPMSPSNHTSLVKIGDLDGISNSFVTPNGDGIYIRSGAAANQFIVADDNGLQLRGADFSQYNDDDQTVLIESDDGSMTLGTDISDPDQVGFAFDGTGGNVTIGNPNYASTVTVYGQIYIANPEDIDTSDLTNGAGWTAGATWGSNIGNQPSSLGDINSTEGTKLSGIAAGATVGATWGTNLGNIPDRFGEAPSDPGLYLTGTHLGYFDGSNWKAWMAATGEFYFGGNSGAHLQWSGRYLRGIGSGSTVQWFADSEDGVFYFGGGSGWLDSSGLAIETGSSSASALANVNKVRWVADADSDPHFWIGATKTLATTEAVLWAEDPDGDTTQLTALAIAGATNNALVTLQATVGSNSSQWIFSRLSSGSVFASFPGEIRVDDVKPQSNNGGDLGTSDLYYDHAYISNLHVSAIVGTPTYSHSHSAGDITSGTLALARIPNTLTGKSADFLDGLNSSDFALAGHSHAYLPLAGGQLTGNITFIGSQTVDGVDISAFYTAYSNHNHDTRYYTETESDARFVLKSGDTMYGALTAPAIKNALLSQPSQIGVDLSMVGYFDRNELIYSNLAGNVTVSITGAGTAYNTHYMLDGTGESSEINGTNATTTQIRITIDRGSGVSVYSRAQWQPFVAFRYLGFSQYTYYNHIVCEVSLDGVSWYKPSGGQWETSDAAGEASNGSVWMGSEALPTSLPSPYAWRYARFTLTDRIEGSSYPGIIWISQVGMRHVSAPFSRIWLDRAGDTMLGDFVVKSGSTNVFDVDISTATTTATGLFNVTGDASITGDLDIEDDLTVDGTITTSTVISGSDLNLYTNDSTNRVFTNGLLTGGFGTAATSGTLDWNHSSNARSGQGYTLLTSVMSNGPSRAGSIYFHPFGFEHSTKDGTGNITQLAIPYSYEAGINAGIWMRGRYLSSWTDWVRVISENTNGSVGINTTSPSSSYKLDVNGDSRVNGSLTVGSAIINAAAAASSATFSHTSFADSDSFALAQFATGATQINAHAGQYIDLSIDDESTFLVNSQRLLPRNSIEVDIGDYNRLVRSIFAAEIVAQTLVASEIYATVGGGIRVSPTTKLIADVGASDTTIDVEHNNLVSGEYVELRTAPLGLQQFEAMQVTSGATSITGGYRYSVDRNLDGTGANNWLAGDAVVSMRTNAGEGWIEMTATSTVFNHLGPTTTYYARTDTANWNDVVPVVTQGNMRSFVDYASDEFGAGIGNDLTLTPTSGLSGLTADRTNGLRLFNTSIALYDSATQTVSIDATGDIKAGTNVSSAATTSFDFDSGTGSTRIGFLGTNKPNLYYDAGAGSLSLRNNTTEAITLFSDGSSYFTGVMQLGTGGEIRHGTGTLGSDFTGLRIWRDTGVGRIAGYNNNTIQWYAGTNGKLYAGGGAVLLDVSGLTIATNKYTVDTSGNIKAGTNVGSSTTTTFDFTASTGQLRVGTLAASKANLYYDGSNLNLRTNTTTVAQIGASGTMIVGRTGTNSPNLYYDGSNLNLRMNTTNVISLSSSGASTFENPINLGTNGGIYQGSSGSFASPGTGLKIWRESNAGRIAGYNGGTVQWAAGTDGKLYAGAGSVVMDSSGVTVASTVTLDSTGVTLLADSTSVHTSQSDTNAITFERSGGTLVGRLTSYYISASADYGLDLYARAPNSEDVFATFGAEQADAIYGGGSAGAPRVVAYSQSGGGDYLRLYSSGSIELYNSGSATPDVSISSGEIDLNGNDLVDTGSVTVGASSGSHDVHIFSTGTADLALESTGTGGTKYVMQSTSSGDAPGAGYLEILKTGVAAANRLVYDGTNGRFGVGVSNPSYKLDVNGSAHASSFPTSSDARFKENLAPINSTLDKLTSLPAYNFTWTENYSAYEQFLNKDGTPTQQLGFLAQEVAELFPEVITRWQHTGRDGKVTKDAYSVDYARMVPLLVVAIRELKQQLQEMRQQ